MNFIALFHPTGDEPRIIVRMFSCAYARCSGPKNILQLTARSNRSVLSCIFLGLPAFRFFVFTVITFT